MAQATVFNPVTKQRKVVTVGDPNAFAGGFMLETPTQNLKTYTATPPKEITRDGSQLFARDNTAGTSTPVQNPAALGGLVNSGYQDSRAPIFGGSNMPGSSMAGASNPMSPSAPTPTAPPVPPASGPSSPSSVNPADSYNFAISSLLRQAQSANTGDQDLMEQRNKIIQERFNAGNTATPDNLRVLSPGQQSSLRGQQQSGLEDQLTGVNSAIQSREKQRDTAMNLVQQANQMLKDYQANENQTRDDARNLIKDQITLFGSDAFGNASPQELAHLEGQAGLPPGSLAAGQKTLKEKELAAKSDGFTLSDGQTRYDAQGNPIATAGGGPGDSSKLLTPTEAAALGVPYGTTRGEAAARSIVAPLTPQQTQNFINITNKYQADSIVKQGAQATTAVQIANQVLADPGKATNQLKALYSLVHNLDPQSAVREGELALANQTQSFFDRFATSIKSVTDGQLLSPEATRNLAMATKDLAQTWADAAKRRDSQYQAQAQVAGVGDAFKQYMGGFSQNYGQPDSFGGGGGQPTNTPKVTIDSIEQSIGTSLSAQKRQDAQEAIDAYRSGGVEPSVDDIAHLLGFKSESQTSLNGQGSQNLTSAIVSVKPQGAYGGQCGEFVHSIVANYPYGLNSIESKESVINVPNTELPQVGDVVIQRIGGKSGHVAVVNAVDPLTGHIRLTESNYYDKSKPERVTNDRVISMENPSISGYFRGKLKV